MPKVDFKELLTDRTKYPDDMEIALADGNTISVKEWRDGAMPKADFTKATEGWSRKEQEYRGSLDAANENLRRAVEERQQFEARINAQPTPTVPARPGEFTEEELMADPVVGRAYRKVKEAEDRLKAHEDRLKVTEERLTGHEKTFMRTQFTKTIADLKSRDPDLNENEFLSYTQKFPVVDTETGTVDLGRTYREYRHDHLLTAAEKAAEERGVEKGREAARVPKVPFGGRRGSTRPEGLPAHLGELDMEKVAADPDIQRALQGEEE